MLRMHLEIITIALAITMLEGCGAPLKKADDVKHIFADSQDIFQKVTNLCRILQGRQQTPNLNGIALANQVCRSPSSNPYMYDDLQNVLPFTTFLRNSSTNKDVTVQGATNEIFKVQTRSELWLSRSLLQLAVKVFNSLQNETNSILGQGGSSSSQNNDFNFQIIGKPKFDTKAFEFSIEFNLNSTKAQNGLVDINNTLRATGQLFEKKYIAVKAETIQDMPKEKSLIKSARILILLVPHSGDIFMDISTDFDFHSFGVDQAFSKEIEKTLGTGLKSVPDLVAKLDRGRGIYLQDEKKSK